MTRTELLIKNLADEIRVHGAIVVLGAGASFESGLPLYGQFAPILWQVVDEFPQIKNDLGYNTDIPAKYLISNDNDDLKSVFPFIERYEEASLRFKQVFKFVNDKHNSGHSFLHEYLCELVHAGDIKIIISLNWDDLLESAWKRLYGTEINDNKVNLLKPHGDVRNIDKDWIFPHKPGYLSDSHIDSIKNITKDGPSTLVILGYSEQDKVIVDSLIRPNEAKLQVFRISPSALDSISLKASEAFEILKDNMSYEVNQLWRRLDFSNQVGLEHAIMGYRLLPSDVNACPRLPQIEDIKLKLENAHSIILKGAPGCGKSITAYQIAYDYLNNGWEVLKLETPRLLLNSSIRFVNDGYKTIYIIDDAQQIEDDLVINLMEQANNMQKIIITQTLTSDFPFESVTICKEQSVKAIYNYYMKNKKEVMPIIKKTNKNVGRDIGDFYMDTPYKFVLDVALQENTPWLFNYSLRGGWQNTKNDYNIAREHERSDVILTLIAFKQIITLDTPVEINWLYKSSQLWGYSPEWCDITIQFLYKEKMILDLDKIRTLHLQTAIRIIVNFVEHNSDEECLTLYSLIQNELLKDITPLQGILWFFNLLFGFKMKHKIKYYIFSEGFSDKLLDRCLLQHESNNRSNAAYVIDSVLHRDGRIKYAEIFEKNKYILKTWIEQVDKYTALSFSHILNNILNEDQEYKKKFVATLKMEGIIRGLKNLNTKNLFEWSEFINRLLMYQTKKWRNQFYDLIPKNDIHTALVQSNPKEIYGMIEMLCTLIQCNVEYAHEEYYHCLPIIKKAFEQNFIDGLSQLDSHFNFCFLGARLFEKSKPNNLQKKAGKAFVECISVDMIANTLERGTPREWRIFFGIFDDIQRYDSLKMQESINKIDLEIIDKQTKDMWITQPDELLMLAEIIRIYKIKEVDDWIYSNRDDMEKLRTPLIYLSPKTAKYMCYSNRVVQLIDKSHHWWEMSAEAISKLKSYNKELCSDVIGQNKEDIKESIINLSPLDWDDYYKFISSLIKADSALMLDMLNEIDNTRLKENWEEKLYSKVYTVHNKKKSLNGFLKLIRIINKFAIGTSLEAIMSNFEVKINELLLIEIKQ